MARFWLITEIGTAFILIMGQIWIWRDYQYLVLLPLLLVIISWYLRKDNSSALGFYRRPDFKTEFVNFFILASFMAAWLFLCLMALLANPTLADKLPQAEFWLKYGKKILFYLPWAFFQQLCANGYFANRINVITKNPEITAYWIGAIFAVIHFPNPVLMTVTFTGGALSAFFFLKGGSLYYLAAAHAVLAPTIRMFLDYSLRIGPGFWK